MLGDQALALGTLLEGIDLESGPKRRRHRVVLH